MTEGSIVSFNVVDAAGVILSFSDVGKLALEKGITLRTGKCIVDYLVRHEFIHQAVFAMLVHVSTSCQ